MPTLPELVKDPVFQLNVLLWLAQPLPQAYQEIIPLFYGHGFDVYALALGRLNRPNSLDHFLDLSNLVQIQ